MALSKRHLDDFRESLEDYEEIQDIRVEKEYEMVYGYLPMSLKVRAYQRNRIYSDEVPMADLTQPRFLAAKINEYRRGWGDPHKFSDKDIEDLMNKGLDGLFMFATDVKREIFKNSPNKDDISGRYKFRIASQA